MMKWINELASRRKFGVRPGLENISGLCRALGEPQKRFKAIHIAGTNGKGAVSAVIDSFLKAAGITSGRYTSPHLVKINERFFVDARPCADEVLEELARRVFESSARFGSLTFFEALTAVAFCLFEDRRVDYGVLECGLGGRFDATNVCEPCICVITKIGLDHSLYLGETEEKIAFEKAGIIKPDVPVVLAKNSSLVRSLIKEAAERAGAPFYYAPDLVSEDEIPGDFSLEGAFNRENAITAVAALKVLGIFSPEIFSKIEKVIWPGRFQRVHDVIIDGAHNVPGAVALASALEKTSPCSLVAGFCADKDVDGVLKILSRVCRYGFAVPIKNERSLPPCETKAAMERASIEAESCVSLSDAVHRAREKGLPIIVCGSLFLVGEALVEFGVYPWPELLQGKRGALIDLSERFSAG
jgi:dihydrofolate synthase/folylpolyglutamate synthase